MRLTFFALFAFSLGFSGCAGDNRESLTEALHVFNDGVRWQRIDWSIGYVPKEKRPDYLARRANRPGIRVTGYDIQSVQLEHQRARVFIQLSWYDQSGLRLLVTVIEQDWRLGDSGWQVVDERRVGGAPFPLIS